MNKFLRRVMDFLGFDDPRIKDEIANMTDESIAKSMRTKLLTPEQEAAIELCPAFRMMQ